MKLTAVVATTIALALAPTQTEAGIWTRLNGAYLNHLNAGGPSYQSMFQYGCSPAGFACDEDDDDLGLSFGLQNQVPRDVHHRWRYKLKDTLKDANRLYAQDADDDDLGLSFGLPKPVRSRIIWGR